MTRSIELALGALLLATLAPVLAQAAEAPSTPASRQPMAAIGATGTMYDGNNAELKKVTEGNPYWANVWTGSNVPINAPSASSRTTTRSDM